MDEILTTWTKYRGPFPNLKNIFPDIFDGTVGRFEGEAELKLSPDAKLVQLPLRTVFFSGLC